MKIYMILALFLCLTGKFIIAQDIDDYQPLDRQLLNDRVKSIRVARSPQQVILSADDHVAFIRCFLGNSIAIVKIPEFEISTSLTVPAPSDCALSHDSSKLYVASFTEFMIPEDPPETDCSTNIIYGEDKSLLTIIDAHSTTVIRTDTIALPFARKILQPLNDSILYLVGNAVVEYNLSQKQISRQWEIARQILSSEIDPKNNKIFMTAIDSNPDTLFVIDLVQDSIIKLPYYSNGDQAIADIIGVDTSGNRIFVQGKTQPYSEVLVFNSLSLNQLVPIKDASLWWGSFVICPGLNSIYLGSFNPAFSILELDHSTLNVKNQLFFTESTYWKTVIYNDDLNRLYTFNNGAKENELSIINPEDELDLIEYDINTGQLNIYETTDFIYGCSYTRSLAVSGDGKFVMITNSPENSISLVELSPEGVPDPGDDEEIQIYPNPTHSSVEIIIPEGISSDYTIEVYNMFSEKLLVVNHSKSKHHFSLDLTSFPAGQYLIRFHDNQQAFMKKIIKL